METGKKARTLLSHAGKIQGLRFTRDGKQLVSSALDGMIRIWNPEHERATDVIPLGPANHRLVFDLDPSSRFIIAAGDTQLIYVLKLSRPPEDAAKPPLPSGKSQGGTIFGTCGGIFH